MKYIAASLRERQSRCFSHSLGPFKNGPLHCGRCTNAMGDERVECPHMCTLVFVRESMQKQKQLCIGGLNGRRGEREEKERRNGRSEREREERAFFRGSRNAATASNRRPVLKLCASHSRLCFLSILSKACSWQQECTLTPRDTVPLCDPERTTTLHSSSSCTLSSSSSSFSHTFIHLINCSCVSSSINSHFIDNVNNLFCCSSSSSSFSLNPFPAPVSS